MCCLFQVLWLNIYARLISYQCSKQSMYYQIRLHFQQHGWSSPLPPVLFFPLPSVFFFFSSPPPAFLFFSPPSVLFFCSPHPSLCNTPPVNTTDRVVLMQISWIKCLFFKMFSSFKISPFHWSVQIYTHKIHVEYTVTETIKETLNEFFIQMSVKSM